MRKNTRFSQLPVIVLQCVLLAGCATAPPKMLYVPADMLPEGGVKPAPQQPRPFTGQSLVIAPVTGVGASNLRVLGGAMGVPATAQIWGQTFHEALFRALRDSHLFADLAPDGAARFALHADILQQSVAGYGATFNVRYTLSDRQSGRVLWARDIAASYGFSATAGSFLAPYNTQLLALMRACGKNIASLLDNLAAPADESPPPTPAAPSG